MLLLSLVSLFWLISNVCAVPAAAEGGPTVDLGYGLWKATVNV